jgi:hypothetical protein
MFLVCQLVSELEAMINEAIHYTKVHHLPTDQLFFVKQLVYSIQSSLPQYVHGSHCLDNADAYNLSSITHFLLCFSFFHFNVISRAGADDKPLRMVKTVLHELVKLRGTAIKGHLSMVPIDMEPQPIILAYIDLNLQVV